MGTPHLSGQTDKKWGSHGVGSQQGCGRPVCYLWSLYRHSNPGRPSFSHWAPTLGGGGRCQASGTSTSSQTVTSTEWFRMGVRKCLANKIMDFNWDRYGNEDCLKMKQEISKKKFLISSAEASRSLEAYFPFLPPPGISGSLENNAIEGKYRQVSTSNRITTPTAEPSNLKLIFLPGQL